MSRSAEVLAVPHSLQGPGFKYFVDDPSYRILAKALILDNKVDFVFEEAAGHGPSIAEDLAESLLGRGRYLDLDPPVSDRGRYGIAEQTAGWIPIDPLQIGEPTDGYEWTIVNVQENREKLWLQRVEDQSFERALVICGTAHGLSLSFRLSSAGIGVNQTYTYLPHHKLCMRRHED